MFTNIGKKIKILAMVVCWVGIAFSVISAIVTIVLAAQSYGHLAGQLIAVGVVMLILGPLFSWIGSFVLYGFGELIDKTADIERNTNPYMRGMQPQYPPQYPPQYAPQYAPQYPPEQPVGYPPEQQL